MKTEARHGRNILSFQQVVDDLLAVLSVGTVADMHPIDACLIVLPNQLVKLAMALDPFKPLLALCLVTIYTEVCCLAFQVLTVIRTAYRRIEGHRAEAAADAYSFTHCRAQGLQDIVHQCTEVAHLLCIRHIAYALGRCRTAGSQLLQREVLTDLCCHLSSSDV